MKKCFILSFLLIVANISFSQDIIYKSDGTEIKSKILEVSIMEIKYKKFENLNGPTYTISKNEVFLIKYQNGEKQIFKKEDNKANNNDYRNSKKEVSKNNNYKDAFIIGPTVGISWGIAFGITADYGLTNNIFIGSDIMYSSYSEIGTNYKLIGILAAASYHFDFLGKEWDPYIKGGLGYMKWKISGIGTAPSAFGITLQGGARYYVIDNMALRASLGFPYYIGVGVDFKL